MDDQNQPVTPAPIYQESQEKNAKWLWLLIILIIIGAIAFAFFRGIGPFAAISPFVEKEALPSPTVQAISSPITQPSPDAEEEVDKSEPSIRILNGSGVAGKASAVKDFLEGLGWTVASVGNADSYDFTSTEVKFKEDFKNFESVLISDLSEEYNAEASSDDLDATDSADIEIIVGSE